MSTKRLVIRGGAKLKGTINPGTGDSVLTLNSVTNEVTKIGSIDTSAFLTTSLTSGWINVGNASNIATPRQITGQILFSNLGVTSITPGTITTSQISPTAGILYSQLNLTGSILNADINSSAAITRVKLASGTANVVLVNNGSGVMSEVAPLTALRVMTTDVNGLPTITSITTTNLATLDTATSLTTQLSNKLSFSASLTPAAGDLISFIGGVWSRFAIGTSGQYLTVNPGGTGVQWTTTPNGVPLGGTTAQILAKNSSTSFDTGWFTLTTSLITDITVTAAAINSVNNYINTTGSATGTPGQVLTVSGGNLPTWTTVTGTGTVTSINASGGTTGLTFSGGPISTSGTLTLAGTLVAVDGGTGQTAVTTGDLLYGSAANTWSRLAAGTINYVLTSNGPGTAPSWQVNAGGGGGVTSVTGTANQITASPTVGAAILSLPSNVAFPGTWSIGTLGYSDTGILASLQNSLNSYNQIIIQNTSAGTSASTNMIVSNNSSSGSTFFGEFGMNSSGFTGTGSFNLPSAVYLDATSGDLVIGTTTNNSLRFVVNGSTTDTITISGAGAITLPAFNTTGIVHNSSAGLLSTSLIVAADVTTNTLTYNKIQQATALSIHGNSTNATANLADIVGTTDQVLRVSGAGTSLGFGSIDLSKSATVGSSILPVANGGTGSATQNWWGLSGTSTFSSAVTIVGSNSNTLTYSFPSIGTAVTNGAGLWLQNSTAAAAGSQQWSPAIILEGQGWKTPATAGSQPFRIALYNTPIQSGQSTAGGSFVISGSRNSGGYTNMFESFIGDNTITSPYTQFHSGASANPITLFLAGTGQSAMVLTSGNVATPSSGVANGSLLFGVQSRIGTNSAIFGNSSNGGSSATNAPSTNSVFVGNSIAPFIGTATTPNSSNNVFIGYSVANGTAALLTANTSVIIGASAISGVTNYPNTFTITAGTGYTSGTYNSVTLTASGGVANMVANIVVSGGGVTTVTYVSGGAGARTSVSWTTANTNIGGTGTGFSVIPATIFQAGTDLTVVGYNAAASLTYGANCVVIGSNADIPGLGSVSNQLSIQNIIYGTGNSGTGTTRSTGKIGIGEKAPAGTFHVTSTGTYPTLLTQGQGSTTNYSYRAFQNDGTTEIYSLQDSGLFAHTSTINGSSITSTWTSTANNQFGLNFTGTITPRNNTTENNIAYSFTPTFATVATNSSSPTAILVNATFDTNSLGTAILKLQANSSDRFTISRLGNIVATQITGQETAVSSNETFLTLNQAAANSLGAPLIAIKLNAGAHTGVQTNSEVLDIFFATNRTISFQGNSLKALQRTMYVGAPTFQGITAGAVVTDAATLYIDGAPKTDNNTANLSTTNTHGVYIATKALTTQNTNSFGLTVSAMTGATNNFTAQFVGNTVKFIGLGSTTQKLLDAYQSGGSTNIMFLKDNGDFSVGLSTSSIGLYATTPTVQGSVGTTLVNNVTSGGTTGQIDDFTSLTVYATDAPAIRNDIYQLSKKLNALEAKLKLLGAVKD